MKIDEITNNSVELPDEEGLKKLDKAMKHPLTPEEAMTYVLPIINTPLLKQTLKSLNMNNHLCDARPHIVDYLKAEYPQIVDCFVKLDMLRSDNIEGTLSPLGHKDEED
jgi:hypothetical protein